MVPQFAFVFSNFRIFVDRCLRKIKKLHLRRKCAKLLIEDIKDSSLYTDYDMSSCYYELYNKLDLDHAYTIQFDYETLVSLIIIRP